jgi:hypothetical protein
MEWEEGLRMAQWMKEQDANIKAAIFQCQANEHGVVALKFTNGCREGRIEILDEPFGDDVRVYPG